MSTPTKTVRECSVRRRLDWDWTHSDMSRYRLAPAEQLRRQLLRISKNQTEAASEVQRKLRRMQENIAPFTQELEQMKSSSSSQARSGHMTPCFASRVPTGRFPSAGSGRGRGTGRLPLRDAATRGPQPRTASSLAQQAEVSAYGPEDILGEALEAEIGDFFAGVGNSSPGTRRGGLNASWRGDVSQGRSSVTPERKPAAQSPALEAFSDASEEALLRPGAQGGQPSPSASGGAMNHRGNDVSYSAIREGSCGSAFSESDPELAEIEAGARRLEDQLSWWRQQQETLLSSPASAVGGGDPEGSGELLGRSEWLLLPGLKLDDLPDLPQVDAPEAEEPRVAAEREQGEVLPDVEASGSAAQPREAALAAESPESSLRIEQPALLDPVLTDAPPRQTVARLPQADEDSQLRDEDTAGTAAVLALARDWAAELAVGVERRGTQQAGAAVVGHSGSVLRDVRNMEIVRTHQGDSQTAMKEAESTNSELGLTETMRPSGRMPARQEVSSFGELFNV